MALDLGLVTEPVRRLWNARVGVTRVAVVVSGTLVVAGGGILAASFQAVGGADPLGGHTLEAAVGAGGADGAVPGIADLGGRSERATPTPAPWPAAGSDDRGDVGGTSPSGVATTAAAPTTTIRSEAPATTGGTAEAGNGDAAPAAVAVSPTASPTTVRVAAAPGGVTQRETTTTTLAVSPAPAPTFATEWPTLVSTTLAED